MTKKVEKVAEQIGKADAGTFLFRVSDAWAEKLAAGWSEPVRLKLQRTESFYYELVAEAVQERTGRIIHGDNVGDAEGGDGDDA